MRRAAPKTVLVLAGLCFALAVPSVRAAAKPATLNPHAGSTLYVSEVLPPPKAWTRSAYGVNATEAVLTGFINARGHNTVWRFKWGTTKAYGNIAPPGGIEEGFSDGRPEQVAAILIGLDPRTTYHYRIVAYSHGKKTFGGDRTFTTKRWH